MMDKIITLILRECLWYKIQKMDSREPTYDYKERTFEEFSIYNEEYDKERKNWLDEYAMLVNWFIKL